MATQVFADILTAARSADAAIREPAVAMMRQMEEENLVNYLGSLAQELADTTKGTDIRILAATQLNNAVTARSESNQQRLALRYLAQDNTLRSMVRELLLHALSTIVGTTGQDRNLRNTTAKVIATIASIELPSQQWQDLVPKILSLARGDASNPGLLISAFTTLGYICEAIPGEDLQPMANEILTVIASGMATTQPHEIISCATHALTDALPFCSQNFEQEGERTMIMGMISGVMAIPNPTIQIAAWQCLGEIAENYYDYLGAYIGGIYNATVNTITSLLDALGDNPVEDEESAKVAMQAIEFWTTIGLTEHNIMDQMAEDDDEGERTEVRLLNYCAAARDRGFMALVLRALTKQSEDGDEDELTLASAAGACLNEFCFVIGPQICDEVVTWVRTYIAHNDWHYREAACFALGCILETHNVRELAETMLMAMDMIFALLRDDNIQVRSSAAWCLKQAASRLPALFTDPARLNMCLTSVLASLDDDIRVVKYTCAVIYHLTAQTVENADDEPEDGQLAYGSFSPYFQGFVEKLISIADNSTDSNMHVSCYEAVMQLVKFSADDVHDNVAALLPLFAQRLHGMVASVAGVVVGEDTLSRLEDIANLQALTVSILQTIMIVMSAEQIGPHADGLMTSFLGVLAGPTMATGTSVGEETLMAITEFAAEAKTGFMKYMPTFVPHLAKAIEDPTDTDFCIAGIRALSAICCALEGMLSLDDMDTLLGALLSSFSASENVDRRVKLTIVEVMPEIKISLGANFMRYLSNFMAVFVPASRMALTSAHSADDLDVDTINFLVDLQAKFLTAYLSFLTLAYDNVGEHLAGSIEPMVQFAVALMADPELRSSTLVMATEFIGDCCMHAKSIHADMPKMLIEWGAGTVIERAAGSTRKKPKKAAVVARSHYDAMLR